jgi:hypothetical protein
VASEHTTPLHSSTPLSSGAARPAVLTFRSHLGPALLAVVCVGCSNSTAPRLQQAAERLLELYKESFSTSHHSVQQQQAARKGHIEPSHEGVVSPLGVQFPLVGMPAATRSFVKALKRMATFFLRPDVEYATSLHVLRFVGAPGG